MNRKRAFFKYNEIADYIRGRISAGEFHPGEMVPGQREIARMLSVSRPSIRRAIDVLEQEGILECRPSVGTIVKLSPAKKVLVGYLVDDLMSPFHNEIMRELDRQLGERDAALIISQGRKNNRLLEMGASKMIKSSGLSDTFRDDSVPTVYIGGGGPSSHRIDSDNRTGMRLILDHLRGLGHEQIAYFGPGDPETNTRCSSLAEAMAKDGQAMRDEDRFPNSDSCEAVVERIMNSGSPPTALVCFDDNRAIKFMKTARARGLDIPGRLSITGFDNIPVTSMLEVPLTTVSFSAKGIVEKALRILFDSNLEKPLTEVVTAELIVRESTTVPPAQK